MNWTRWGLIGVVVVTAVGVGWYILDHGKPAQGSPPQTQNLLPTTTAAGRVSVEVVAPRPGGIDRICTQPGTLEPFESADLYARVSGYLAEQKVDRGSRVRQGDVLARIAVPEHEQQVQIDQAEVARANAKVDQLKAAIRTAEADLAAAASAVALAKAEKASKSSFRAYRSKQRDRIQDLVENRAIDRKLADEQEDQYQAALSAEAAAEEAVGAARQKEAASKSRVAQAHADLKHAEAEVALANARLEKAKVMLDYATIRSPYTGVVTRRSFHPGDFVRSAETGGERVPLLVVERTDRMRVVVQIPERDVPFVTVGDPAVITLDAFPGMVIKNAESEPVRVSRISASEDPKTRMMHTEVDIGNPDGTLRRGMFGRVTITLHAGVPGSTRIPSAALVGKADGGVGSVRVVRDDTVQIVPVKYGSDNGSEVEVLSGLTPADRVIVRASGPVEAGTLVAVAQ